jgi:mannose-6-phosphate isomerase-like protein (cupin superfamily)
VPTFEEEAAAALRKRAKAARRKRKREAAATEEVEAAGAASARGKRRRSASSSSAARPIVSRGTRDASPLPADALPADVRPSESTEVAVPAVEGAASYVAEVLRREGALHFEALPVVDVRAADGPGAALAAASFDTDAFISGVVRLDPGAMKDAESTHNCNQFFVVLAAQPGAVQVDVGGRTLLVGPGDHFFVPTDTEYRLVNHSPHTAAEIVFVVVKPRA